ncbi:Nif3-like dinuclear metal center hexameric protein [Sporosarcina sp. JAI121]|uniref:Nif3-like dinuclear metal center hexameric protein n=1 Tax=Sporosarcina sp. JAI121 TaxID=2723064 RepID=UPI0015C841F5|nr:dinuclear metal center YbgI/SA1388 family protein [Sporosarcina sp. JAI121]
MKKVNGHEVIELFEQWSPKRFAMDGDPIGLHIGQLNRPVEKVLVTLDVNEEVIDEAIEKGASLVIAHHPPIFRPLKSLKTDTPQGRMIEKCIKNDIAVYAAHTNLDVAPGGVNDMLASKLGLVDTEIVERTFSEPLYKMIVFSPLSHSNDIRQALAKAGAGAIGDYAGCSFSSTGIGRFTPTEGADPFLGEIGKGEEVKEERIEVVLPGSLRSKVLNAMLNAHPYEEPAYDFFALDQRSNEYGLGRIGKLPEKTTLAQFAELVKTIFKVPALRFVGDPNKEIHKVAVLGGDGNKYIGAAKRSGADVLVTGDLYYHVAHDAEAMGLAVIDPGHNIEKVMISGVVDHMHSACKEAGYHVSFIESVVITEPFTFI